MYLILHTVQFIQRMWIVLFYIFGKLFTVLVSLLCKYAVSLGINPGFTLLPQSEK
jgi:hypothetical protein